MAEGRISPDKPSLVGLRAGLARLQPALLPLGPSHSEDALRLIADFIATDA